jgi:hypothetical protein
LNYSNKNDEIKKITLKQIYFIWNNLDKGQCYVEVQFFSNNLHVKINQILYLNSIISVGSIFRLSSWSNGPLSKLFHIKYICFNVIFLISSFLLL